jgi:hypothetical protein
MNSEGVERYLNLVQQEVTKGFDRLVATREEELKHLDVISERLKEIASSLGKISGSIKSIQLTSRR